MKLSVLVRFIPKMWLMKTTCERWARTYTDPLHVNDTCTVLCAVFTSTRGKNSLESTGWFRRLVGWLPRSIAPRERIWCFVFLLCRVRHEWIKNVQRKSSRRSTSRYNTHTHTTNIFDDVSNDGVANECLCNCSWVHWIKTRYSQRANVEYNRIGRAQWLTPHRHQEDRLYTSNGWQTVQSSSSSNKTKICFTYVQWARKNKTKKR